MAGGCPGLLACSNLKISQQNGQTDDLIDPDSIQTVVFHAAPSSAADDDGRRQLRRNALFDFLTTGRRSGYGKRDTKVGSGASVGRTHSDMGGDAFDEGRVPPGEGREASGATASDDGGAEASCDPPWKASVDAAKEEAQRQFAQMFTRPEDLARLAELREGVAAKLHRAEADLAAKLNAAVDDVRFGIEALHSARKAVVDTRENFATIDALCEAEGSGLADHHDIIRDLAVMRVNISKTLADAEAIIALPAQVAAAMELLDDERNLFACWERLTELERRSRPARAALEAEAARRQPQGGTSRAAPIPTAAHFAAIDNATKEFEDTLLRSVRESIFAGRGCGRALVRALRVVEEQETLEALLAAKVREDASRFFGDDANDVEKGKQYKKRVMREVRKAVSERFAATVDALVPDEDASDETATAADVPKVLETLDVLMQQLTEAYDYAIPAFPPKYHAFDSVLAPAWHRRITVFLGKLGGKAARDFSNADIIAVLNWYQAYASQMDALGVDVETVPSDISVVPEALATPPAPVPTVPQTPRTVAPPLTTKASSRRDTEATGGSGSQGGPDEPSMMSLESFLATGRAVASDGIDLERTEQSLGNDGAKTDNVSTPPRVAPREDRAGAVDSSVADDELEDDDEGFGYPLGLVKLVDVYTFRMSQTVSTWSTNLRKMTATQPLREAEDGTLWTASDVEFFRLLNEQLEVATDGGQQLVSAAAVVFSSALLDFASQQHKRLGGDASANPPIAATGLSALSSPTHFRRPSTIAGGLLERTPQDRLAVAAAKAVEYNVLLAGVNDATRCHKLASEIEASLSEALGSADIMRKLAAQVVAANGGGDSSGSVVQPALDAFKRNAEHSAAAAAAAVSSDPSVVTLFGQLFVVDKAGGGGWIEGEVTETLVATIADYLGDVEQYVTRELAPMVAEAVLARVVKITTEVCMRQLHSIRPGTVDRMEADEAALRECFADHLQHKHLEPWLQRLAEIRDLAAADDAESFVLAFGLLMRSAPELGIEAAERLLAARDDIPRTVQRDILEECRELLSAQLTSALAAE